MSKKPTVTQEPVEGAEVDFKLGAEQAQEAAQADLFPETVVTEGSEDPNKTKVNAPVKREVLHDGTIVEHF